MGTAIAVGTLAITTILASFQKLVDPRLAAAKELASAPPTNDPSQLSKQVHILLDFAVNGSQSEYSGYAVLAFIFSVVLAIAAGIIVGIYADSARPSFVTLTKNSIERKKIVLRSYNNDWMIFAGSLVAALAFSIAGNYLFYLIAKYWLSAS